MPQIFTDKKYSGYLYTDLTHKLIGLSYKIFNNMGYGFQEKYYQRAFAEELRQENYSFKQEQQILLRYNDKIIGRYFVDFVIDNKVVIEFKVASGFYESHVNQVLSYLKSSKLKLGLLILITKNGVKCKRIIN